MDNNFDGHTNVIDYEIIGWHEKDCPEDMMGFKYIKDTRIYLCMCKDTHGGTYYMVVDWDSVNHKWQTKTGLTVVKWTPIKKCKETGYA